MSVGTHEEVASRHMNGPAKHVQPTIRNAKTDHTRWRLKDDRGRQTWHYLETNEQLKQWPQTIADRYFLGMDTVSGGRHQSQPV